MLKEAHVNFNQSCSSGLPNCVKTMVINLPGNHVINMALGPHLFVVYNIRSRVMTDTRDANRFRYHMWIEYKATTFIGDNVITRL